MVGIITVLIGLIVPAVQRARAAAARTLCMNNLRQIGLALHHFHNVQGQLPPGVSYRDGADRFPFMSWLTRILPYVERYALWEQAQKAYQETTNFQDSPPHPLATPMPLYGCPADNRTLQAGLAGGRLSVAFTAYLGVVGRSQVRKDGVLFLDSRVRFSEITDGLSNTLMVGERPPSADGIMGWWYAGWGQAKDGSGDMVLSVREWNVGPYGPGCPAGPYHFGPGRIDNQCDAFHFWSPHLGGGAHFLFCDGSVHFLPYSAAPLMAALASRARGEVVAVP
jgi:prepilin-type processing-associated H-X9-DG protein